MKWLLVAVLVGVLAYQEAESKMVSPYCKTGGKDPNTANTLDGGYGNLEIPDYCKNHGADKCSAHCKQVGNGCGMYGGHCGYGSGAAPNKDSCYCTQSPNGRR